MECLPAIEDTSLNPPENLEVPFVEIGSRLVDGLKLDADGIFPHSSYLNNVKADLKKVLKQK